MTNARGTDGRQSYMVEKMVLGIVSDVVLNNHTYTHINNHISDQNNNHTYNHSKTPTERPVGVLIIHIQEQLHYQSGSLISQSKYFGICIRWTMTRLPGSPET